MPAGPKVVSGPACSCSQYLRCRAGFQRHLDVHLRAITQNCECDPLPWTCLVYQSPHLLYLCHRLVIPSDDHIAAHQQSLSTNSHGVFVYRVMRARWDEGKPRLWSQRLSWAVTRLH
jgi:hypothetical protein